MEDGGRDAKHALFETLGAMRRGVKRGDPPTSWEILGAFYANGYAAEPKLRSVKHSGVFGPIEEKAIVALLEGHAALELVPLQDELNSLADGMKDGSVGNEQALETLSQLYDTARANRHGLLEIIAYFEQTMLNIGVVAQVLNMEVGEKVGSKAWRRLAEKGKEGGLRGM